MAGEKITSDAAGRPDLKVINFMRVRTLATVLSVILVLGSVVSLAVNGINWGLDFTGGTLVELSYDKPADISEIRDQLERMGHGDAIAQEFGSESDVLIRIPVIWRHWVIVCLRILRRSTTVRFR